MKRRIPKASCGPGRRPVYVARLSVAMPWSLRHRIEQEAIARNDSVSALVRRAVVAMLGERPVDPPPTQESLQLFLECKRKGG